MGKYRRFRTYPDDFSEKDFEAVSNVLKQFGEVKEARVIELAWKARQYELSEGTFLNVAKMQEELLRGYKPSYYITDDDYEYEFYTEAPTNLSIEHYFGDDVKIVVSYTDKLTGNTGANYLTYEQFMCREQEDILLFVNESIFYDPNMNQELDLEEE